MYQNLGSMNKNLILRLFEWIRLHKSDHIGKIHKKGLQSKNTLRYHIKAC